MRYLKLYLNFEKKDEPAITKLIGTEVTGVSLRAWILRQAGVQENVTPPYFADPVNAEKAVKKRWKKVKKGGK